MSPVGIALLSAPHAGATLAWGAFLLGGNGDVRDDCPGPRGLSIGRIPSANGQKYRKGQFPTTCEHGGKRTALHLGGRHALRGDVVTATTILHGEPPLVSANLSRSPDSSP